MRVITGLARGHRLETLKGTDTRPTSESVKEAMMSAIQFEIEGARVVDLFAGTGQLGIEALSRGAAHCIFIDQSSRCALLVRDNLTHTKLDALATITVAQAANWLLGATGPFDIAFVDPPYGGGMLPDLLPLLASRMSTGGVILCETGREEQLPKQVGEFSLQKEYSYGKRKVSLYRNR